MSENIREPAMAGAWYPGNEKDLRDFLHKLLDSVEGGPEDDLRALISPHAAMIFSGQIAAYGYHGIDKARFNRVMLMAPSHHYPLSGASVGTYTHFRTPLGKIPVSQKAAEMVNTCPVIKSIDTPHVEEHALEIQLPFLQMVLDEFSLIPLVFGELDGSQIRALSDALLNHMDEQTLIVVSTDLSHFHSYEAAVSRDSSCIESIIRLDLKRAAEQEMCGLFPVLTFLSMAAGKGWSPELLKYANSGDVTGDKSSVVGYASIIFHETD